MTAPHRLSMTRLFNAPPEVVWQAYTDPAILPRWYAPEGLSCETHEIDLRPGGVWRFDMVGNGLRFANRHRILSHDAPREIRFLMDDGTDAALPYEVTVTLLAEGAGTRLTQTILFPTEAALQSARDMGAEALGHTTLAKLAAIVEA